MYHLVLFITGGTAKSRMAVHNLKVLCDAHLGDGYRLEVIDVLEEPQRAERDKVLATPTLVRSSPHPVRKIIGDLSDTRQLLAGLELPLDGRNHPPQPQLGQ